MSRYNPPRVTGRGRGLDSEFLAVMRKKLEQGRRQGKAGWDTHWGRDGTCILATSDECSPRWFLCRILDECIETAVAIEHGDPDQIADECADIANFAMMLADRVKPPNPNPPPPE